MRHSLNHGCKQENLRPLDKFAELRAASIPFDLAFVFDHLVPLSAYPQLHPNCCLSVMSFIRYVH